MQQRSRSRGSAAGEAKIEPVVRTKSDEMSRIGAAYGSGSAPGVSVVVPFYNRSSFLQPVVKTLERQTFKDIELIVVDDGSEDELASGLQSIQTPLRIRLVRLDRNVGAASARNAGIEEASGRYIAFLDSDDCWEPEKLYRQFMQLEKATDPHSLVSLTRQLVIGKRIYVAPRRLPMPAQPVGHYLFQSGGIIQSSMMFMSTDLAKSVRFADGARGHDDWSFALRLEEAGARFEMLPEALTTYNDEPSRARRSPSYSVSRFKWLAEHREQLGEGPYFAAQAAFASNISGNRSVDLLRMIVSAYRCGAIPMWLAAYYGASWLFPPLRTASVGVKKAWLSLRRPRGPGAAQKLGFRPITR